MWSVNCALGYSHRAIHKARRAIGATYHRVRRVGRPSDCMPFRAVIAAKMLEGWKALRIHQELTAKHGFRGSY